MNLRDNSNHNLTVGQKWTPADPIFGFSSIISYSNTCGLSEIWFDLEFGHSATGVSIDIANDGDIEWAMEEPAFGSFGRQTEFWAGSSLGVNYAMDESTITLNTNGEASGGSFMLPIGADVKVADVVMSDNTAGAFDLSLTASGQEVSLGTMPNQSVIAYETVFPMFAFKSAITSLMNNPLLQASHVDAYGNEWATLHFKISNPNAASGTHVKLDNLDTVSYTHLTLPTICSV